MENQDHEFVDAAGITVPPGLAAQRIYGTALTGCGRFARLFVSSFKASGMLLGALRGSFAANTYHCS